MSSREPFWLDHSSDLKRLVVVLSYRTFKEKPTTLKNTIMLPSRQCRTHSPSPTPATTLAASTIVRPAR